MTAGNHTRELEEVMAYLDGALDATAADRVRTHLAGCTECQRVEQELRGVSNRLHAWQVEPAPSQLSVPQPAAVSPERFSRVFAWVWSRHGLVAAAAGVVLVVIAVGMLSQQRKSPSRESASVISLGESAAPGAASRMPELLASTEPLASYPKSPQRQQPAAAQTATVQGPLIVRTARLTIVAADFDAARAEVERVVQRTGGFVGQMVAHGASGASRRLEATLRVPTPRLDETIAALRRLGQVISEAQDGEDVTQQSVDLDTRLANARVSEKRLRDILAQRTGRLSDVLDVEREIARVRGEIEQMESERRMLDRRLTYATVTLSLSEDRKSEVSLGPVPVSRRLRNAFVEGWTNAIGSAVDAAIFAIRIAPTLLFWSLILLPIALLVRRRVFRAS